MTIKQKIIKLIYPLITKAGALAGKGTKILKSTTMAASSFYELKVTLNNGQLLDISTLKGKKVLIVNTASECGYTPQYEALQRLHETYADEVQIIGVPSNEFGQQEKGSDEAIAEFCKVNFGVTFPLAKKSNVLKTEGQHELYRWLTEDTKNGWNNAAPTWNFCKYLVDETGNLTHFFEAGIDPMGTELKEALGVKR